MRKAPRILANITPYKGSVLVRASGRAKAYTRGAPAKQALQVRTKMRSPDLKIRMAHKASVRAARIRAARSRALMGRY